ncbi:probable beta-1,4-xylosyltransferase IRX9H [Nymphaea colorata]|nr:probable beta-1,4-xylosyltransferase IRX9H [Nymphaea colorata]
MASLRRAFSPLHRHRDGDQIDPRSNGGYISVSASSTSFDPPPDDPIDSSPSKGFLPSRLFGSIPLIMFSNHFLSIVIRIPLAKPLRFPDRSSKGRVQSWRRLAVRLLFFFIFGFIAGFSPLGTMDTTILLPKQLDFSFDSVNTTQEDLGFYQPGRWSVHRNEKPGNLIGQETESKDTGKFNGISKFVKPDQAPNKLLIVVTPTYNRAFQAYYLGRLGHTLRLVPPPLLWVVVEMGAASRETADILRRTGVMYRHLVCTKNMSDIKDRGVHQRNLAIEHIRKHELDGVVYFADDDNVYSLELFQKLRDIRRFGTWPVAMLAQNKASTILEGPVCSGRRVVGWHTNEKSKRLRRFHVDMSGFAFNSTILWAPERWHRLEPEPIRQLDTVKEGFQETTFIAQLVEDESQMEGLPDSCSKIMAWHLHVENGVLEYPRGWRLKHNLDAVVPIK